MFNNFAISLDSRFTSKMLKFFAFALLFSLARGGESPNARQYLSKLSYDELSDIPEDILEDSKLDVMGLLNKYGYLAENHEVETSDEYIVTMHRFYSKNNVLKNEDRPVVFLMHGVMGSSSDFIINGPGKGLGYILADLGYDIWMGNARGNYYSRKHTTLNPDKSRKYWLFSWHQVGIYDVPAMIDHVLEKTGKKKIHYIGHSQGTTAFFVMASTRPEYNKKILSMQALAPATFMTNSKSPLKRFFSPYASAGQVIFTLIGFNEFLPRTKFLTDLAHKYCNEDAKLQDFCIYLLFGNGNVEQVNRTMIPLYLSHAPSGASSRQLVHYAQLILTTKFQFYDYGSFGNLGVYGSFNPPIYKLGDISAPVALHYGNNDMTVDPKDVKKLHRELKNSIGLFEVPQKEFGHLDFVWAIDAKTLVYDLVIKILKQYDQK